MGLEDKSYNIHQNLYNDSSYEKELELYRNWFDRNTTDVWRHLRMLSVLDPFLKHDKNAGWLTVGDGRFGTSAIYIHRNGGKATATDIDMQLLELAKKNNMVQEIAYANAEKLPFADNAFDYAYCKQSYHHFPRPALAVYEMLRVSKKAIVFTEPHDFYPPPPLRVLFQKVKHRVKKFLGKEVPHHDTGNYEPVGNYIYGISLREFEKIALGLGLPCIAFKLFQDPYIPGVEDELLSDSAPLYKKLKTEIALTKIKTALGISRPNNIQLVVFKTEPEKNISDALKAAAFQLITFSKNPYL